MTLWRITLQDPARTAPYDTVVYELRAPSEGIAVDRVGEYRPDLEIIKVERRPT